jgi:CheY-like chemotaxis protein
VYIEDDVINAFVLKRMLKGIHSVTHYFDGESCLKSLNTLKIDLFFIDINLGANRMDGIDVMKAIRETENHAKKPIIALTAFAFREDEHRFIKEGFDDYVSKPIERERLLNLIKSHTK